MLIKYLLSPFILMLFVLFSGCAAAGLFTVEEVAILRTAGVVARAGRAGMAIDEAMVARSASSLNIRNAGIRRGATRMITTESGEEILEVIGPRKIKSVTSGRIFDLSGDIHTVSNCDFVHVRSTPDASSKSNKHECQINAQYFLD